MSGGSVRLGVSNVHSTPLVCAPSPPMAIIAGVIAVYYYCVQYVPYGTSVLQYVVNVYSSLRRLCYGPRIKV